MPRTNRSRKNGFVITSLAAVLLLSAACGDGGGPAASGPAVDGDASSDAFPAPNADAYAPDAPNDVADAGPLDAETLPALVDFIGRFDTSVAAGPRFAWPGSEIATTFTGTGVDVALRDDGSNFFRVVVDNGPPTVLQTRTGTSTYALVSNLANSGSHTLTLTKKTESSAGVVQFLGFTPHGGALVAYSAPRARAIEYVGDSITCGYGDLGAGPGCTETNAVEDETVTYAALAADQLNAEPTVIAYSGVGMYRNYSGSTVDQMPVRFTRTLADDPNSVWAFGKRAPEVIVINLGTNDFHSQDGGSPDPGPPFPAAYTSFVQLLRTHAPNAFIVCTLSPMLGNPARAMALSYIQGVVAKMNSGGDARVSFLEFAEQQASDGLGCDYHPSAKTHQIMAAVLVPAIRAGTGW